MSKDALTQSEIDSLINAISSGDLEEEADQITDDYQTYDFRRPTKFSKEQIRTLQIIHDNYARVMGNYLTSFLRVPVKINVVSVAQVSYEEFVFSLPVPTLMTIFNMSKKMGVAMLETNPAFVFTIIDLLFGGQGKQPGKIRELTEIELSVMRQINEKFLDNLSYAWKGIAQLEPQIESMDTNPQFNQVIASSETVALVTFSATIHNIQGFINLCFPFMGLENVLSSLTAQHWFNQFQQAASKSKPGDLEKCLRKPEADVQVVLGKAQITLDDFLQLQEGDVLPLRRQRGEPLELLVEGKPIFKVQPGLKGKQLAVKVVEWISEERSKAGDVNG
ncbi:MAG: flagellar motor switch protein FliM [Bacillota bacterium]